MDGCIHILPVQNSASFATITVCNNAYSRRWPSLLFTNNSYTPYHATPRHAPVTFLSLHYLTPAPTGVWKSTVYVKITVRLLASHVLVAIGFHMSNRGMLQITIFTPATPCRPSLIIPWAYLAEVRGYVSADRYLRISAIFCGYG